jgi:TatD DNase family protein
MESQISFPKSDYSFFDIATNLCDDQFKGIYHGKKYHEEDYEEVLERAKNIGVKKFIFSAGSIEDINISYDLSLKGNNYYITSGIHPTRASEELNKENNINLIFENLNNLILKYKEKIIAIGECGLDYDRLHYSKKEDQLKIFLPHFNLSEKYNLPMYLHSRNCCEDFYNIIKENRNKFNKGVVHSFTGNEDELNKYISLNLFIGINGCSLKTKDNIEVVKKIPLDKLLIETDCPYCEIKSSSASFKLIDTVFKGKVKKDKMKKGLICKDRNEPCSIIQVLEVISKIKNVDKKELSDICYKNSLDCFGLME